MKFLTPRMPVVTVELLFGVTTAATPKNPRLRQNVRGAACWALGQWGNPRAIPTLLDLIKRGGLVVTWESAKSSVTLLDNSACFTRRLEQTLRNGRPSMRMIR